MATSTLGIIVLLVTLVLFVIPRIPLAVSATIGALLMMLIGVLEPKDVCGYFGNYVPILLAGSGIVTAAIFETGLANKAGSLLKKAKFITGNEKVFLLVIIAVSGVMSIFIANMPVMALFMPIIAAVASASNGKIQKKNIYMAMAFAVSMGGSGALVGSSINLTGQASFLETTGLPMTMFSMLPITLITLVVVLVYYATIGDKLQKKFFDFAEVADEGSSENEVEFKPVKAAIAGLTFVTMMVLFVKGVWNFGVVAIMGAVVVIITGCIPFKKALSKVDWSTVIIIAMSLAVAAGVNKSGAGAVIANFILGLAGGEAASPLLLLCIAIVLSSILACVMAHNALVSILIPIFCAIAMTLNVNPLPFAVGIIVGSNNCFLTPVGTATVTMCLSGGYRFNDFWKVGGLLFIILDIILCIFTPILYAF